MALRVHDATPQQVVSARPQRAHTRRCARETARRRRRARPRLGRGRVPPPAGVTSGRRWAKRPRRCPRRSAQGTTPAPERNRWPCPPTWRPAPGRRPQPPCRTPSRASEKVRTSLARVRSAASTRSSNLPTSATSQATRSVSEPGTTRALPKAALVDLAVPPTPYRWSAYADATGSAAQARP